MLGPLPFLINAQIEKLLIENARKKQYHLGHYNHQSHLEHRDVEQAVKRSNPCLPRFPLRYLEREPTLAIPAILNN